VITTSEIRKGTTFEMDGSLYQVVEVHHVKTKRSAVYRVKMRDLRAGHITEHSFNAGEKLATARVERRDMQYLYADEDNLTFMNTETFDQIPIARAMVGDAIPYLKESDIVQVMMFGEEPLGVELSASVELTIEQTDPGVKGDTATGATKPATMTTGLVVQVPLFINQGDTIKISTETGSYLERTASA
jgi:elongation factor P